jgi:hypothetical protein
MPHLAAINIIEYRPYYLYLVDTVAANEYMNRMVCIMAQFNLQCIEPHLCSTLHGLGWKDTHNSHHVNTNSIFRIICYDLVPECELSVMWRERGQDSSTDSPL